MNGNMFPPLIGDKVTVKIPDGFPALMMNVTRELLRDPPDGVREAYSAIAEYLECLLREEHGKDDLMKMVANLNKTDEERYIETLIGSGYSVTQLDKLAMSVQKGWKRHKIRHSLRNLSTKDHSRSKDNVWTHEMITEDVIKTLEDFGISFVSANEAAIKIQKAWRKYHKSVRKPKLSASSLNTIYERHSKDSLDEFDFENNDSDERVNVVMKGQRDYVPPIPDFIDDSDSLKDANLTNIIDQLQKDSYEDEDGDVI